MRRLVRVMVLLALGASLSWAPAWAQDIRINPVPPHVKPVWLPVPGAPQVYYAPNLPTDLFRYRGKYYFYWEGYFYKGKTTKGPWKWVKETPAFSQQIDPAYFKTVKKEGVGTPAPAPPAEWVTPPEAAPAAPDAGTTPPTPAAAPAPEAEAPPAATQEPPAASGPPPAALTPPQEAPATE
ncbi:MAG: hypothetical protein Q8M54_09975 [Desulfobaccales bacterium]|nr:hypothetical protein [Desulfobaccales bacterium]